MGNQQPLYDMAVRICEAAGRGEDIAELAAQIEPGLKRFHKREHISGMNLCYPQDALWDVSAGIRRYWDHAYETFERPGSSIAAPKTVFPQSRRCFKSCAAPLAADFCKTI